MTLARGVPGGTGVGALLLLSALGAMRGELVGTALAAEDGGVEAVDGSVPEWHAAPLLAPEATPAPAATTVLPAIPPAPALPRLTLVALSELQPLFASGPFAEAKRAFDDGRYADALASFDKEDPARGGATLPEARYVRAQALVKTGRFEEASRELLALAELLPALRSRCLFSAASALESLKEFQAAASVYAQVSPGSPLHRDAQLGESRARAALESPPQLDAAAEILKSLAALPPPTSGVGRDIGSEALFSLGQLAEQRGKVKEAARRYRQLWLEHPLAQLAAAAGTQAVKLGAPPATPAQLVARAELILAGNRNVQAIEALGPVAKQLKLGGRSQANEALACEAHFTLAKAFKKERRHTEALVEFGRVLTGCPLAANAEVRMRSLYLAGQSAAVIDPPKAKALFGELVEEFPKSSFADDALFFAADVAAKNLGDPKGAEQELETLVARYPNGDYAEEARFRLFWLGRQAGNAKEGMAQLETIVATAPTGAPRDPEPVRRARYWLGQTEGGQAALAKVAEVWPGDYYADLAGAALGKAMAAAGPPGASPIALQAGSLGADASFQAGLLLLRLGLSSAADEELASVDRRSVSGPGGKAEPLLLLALALTQADDARTAHAIVKSLLELPGFSDEVGNGRTPSSPSSLGEPATETRGPFVRLLFNLAYPRAFRPEIERWAAASAVKPDLLQGLMREESALDPAALSATGAIGLCQLMPATGKRTARRLGLGDVSLQQLQDPDLNIRLGAAYLGELLKRFGGREALAVAAYNAGEAAVDRWLAAAKGEPMDAFVEDIPIAETRHYVKRVLTSEAVYRSLGEGVGR